MRIFFLTLLGLFLALNLAGFLMPKRTVVARDLIAGPGISVQRLHELTADFANWPKWAPSFAAADGHTTEVVLGETTSGVGGTATLVYDGEFAVMLLVAADEPNQLVTIEARLGKLTSNLEGGDGFRSWDTLRFEPLDDGRVRIEWERKGGDLDLALLRLWDHFVIAPSVDKQIEEGLAALAAAAAGQP